MSKTFYKFHLIFIDNQRFNNKEICEIKMHLLSEFHVKLVSPAITWIFHMNFTWIWCEIHVKFMWNISREIHVKLDSPAIHVKYFTWISRETSFTWNSRDNFTWNSHETNFTWNSREIHVKISREFHVKLVSREIHTRRFCLCKWTIYQV